LENPFLKYAKASFVCAHVIALIGLALNNKLRRRAQEQPTITGFVLLYSIFLIAYNSPIFVLSIYPRLLIPVIPFFLWLYSPWLPRKWGLWGSVAACSVVLSWGAGLGSVRALFLFRDLQLMLNLL